MQYQTSFNIPTLSLPNAFIWFRTALLGYFSLPLVRSLYPVFALLAMLLKPTPACSRTLPWMLFADRPAGGLGVILSRPAPFCLDRRHNAVFAKTLMAPSAEIRPTRTGSP